MLGIKGESAVDVHLLTFIADALPGSQEALASESGGFDYLGIHSAEEREPRRTPARSPLSEAEVIGQQPVQATRESGWR